MNLLILYTGYTGLFTCYKPNIYSDIIRETPLKENSLMFHINAFIDYYKSLLEN